MQLFAVNGANVAVVLLGAVFLLAMASAANCALRGSSPQRPTTDNKEATPLQEGSAGGLSWWRIAVFSGVLMPLLFVTVAGLGGLLVMPMEGLDMKHSFGFMASAVTGGAIQLEGHAYMPKTNTAKVIGAFVAAQGIGLFGFFMALLTLAIEPSSVQKRLEQQSTCPSCPRLGVMANLTAAAVVLLIFTSLVFSQLLAWGEGWAFWKAWKTVASVYLGGGIPVAVGSPRTWHGELLLVIIAVCSIEMMALVVSFAGDFATSLMQHDADTPSLVRSFCLFMVWAWVATPLALMVAMALTAVALDRVGEDFTSSFWEALPAVSGGAADVYPVVLVGKASREVVLVVAATVGFFILSVCLAIVQAALAPVVAYVLPPSSASRRWCSNSLARAVAALLLGSSVLTPVMVAGFALPLGMGLSAVEDVPFTQGFWWSVAAQLGGGMDLTDFNIHTTSGRVMGTLTAAWSIGVTGLALGFSASPAVEPLLQRLVATLRS